MVMIVKKFFKFLVCTFECLIIFYVVVMTTFLLCKTEYGIIQIGDYSLISVNKENQNAFSDFSKGNLVVISNKNANNFKVGDSIYYYDTIDKKYVLQKAEIVEIFGDSNNYLYSVLDNNVASSVSFERVIGRYEGIHYAGVGNILTFLQSQVGFLIFVILPIMLLFIYQIYSLILLLKDEKEI